GSVENNGLTAVDIGEATVLTPHGPLMGGETTEALHAAVEEQLQGGRIRIVVDLAEVPWLNSSGIGTLMGCRTLCHEADGELVLANVGERIRAMIERLSLTEQLPCHDSVDDAVSSMEGR
ncbi:STAS domain-containing protein, partial [Gemmatimonadota bacterium]